MLSYILGIPLGLFLFFGLGVLLTKLDPSDEYED